MSFLTRDIVCAQAVEMASDYVEGALRPRDARRYERHLAKCDGCTQYLEQIRATIRATGSVGPEDLEPEALEGLLDVFRKVRSETEDPGADAGGSSQ